jgi:hypothetical protein
MATTPKYQLALDAWLPLGSDGSSILVKAGETITWNGWPGSYMEARNDAAVEMKSALEEMRASGRDLIPVEQWKREEAARRKATKGLT